MKKSVASFLSSLILASSFPHRKSLQSLPLSHFAPHTSHLLCLFLLLLSACSQTPSPNGTRDPFLHPPTKAPTSTLVPPREINLSAQLDSQGRALAPLKLDAPDNCMYLDVGQGVSILDAAGVPAKSLVIQQDYPGKLPPGAFGVPVSYAYRFGPQALRFSSPAKIVFLCLKNLKRSFIFEISVGIQGDAGEWDQLSVQGDDLSIWSRLETLEIGQRYLLVGPAPMGS